MFRQAHRLSGVGSGYILVVTDDHLDELTENIRILVHAELETGHRLVGHPERVPECPVCASRR